MRRGVTSYELVRQDIEAYAKLQFYCCVPRRSPAHQNAATLASKAVKRLVPAAVCPGTGTPIENRLSELWESVRFSHARVFYTNHAFCEKLEKPILKSKKSGRGFPTAAAGTAALAAQAEKMSSRNFAQGRICPKDLCLRMSRSLHYACVQAAVADLGDEQGKLQILAALRPGCGRYAAIRALL